jgi:hypothetical protein
MSRCGVNRWGPGTTCERPINTEAAKELQQRMAAMAKERSKQDQMWDTSSATSSATNSKTAEKPGLNNKPHTTVERNE